MNDCFLYRVPASVGVEANGHLPGFFTPFAIKVKQSMIWQRLNHSRKKIILK